MPLSRIEVEEKVATGAVTDRNVTHIGCDNALNNIEDVYQIRNWKGW